jgi:hypothetical protein
MQKDEARKILQNIFHAFDSRQNRPRARGSLHIRLVPEYRKRWNFRNRRATPHVLSSYDVRRSGVADRNLGRSRLMPHTISHKMKLPLLAGACALAIAFAPASVLAAGGGGHAGGFGAMAASPAMTGRAMPSPVSGSPARPMVAPPDRPVAPVSPSAPDRSSHAPFNNLTQPSEPQPASPDVSSHGPLQRVPTAATGSPTPVAGTRLPIEPSAPRRDPPPQD